MEANHPEGLLQVILRTFLREKIEMDGGGVAGGQLN